MRVSRIWLREGSATVQDPMLATWEELLMLEYIDSEASFGQLGDISPRCSCSFDVASARQSIASLPSVEVFICMIQSRV